MEGEFWVIFFRGIVGDVMAHCGPPTLGRNDGFVRTDDGWKFCKWLRVWGLEGKDF